MTASVQSHIHLSTTLGTAPENSPNLIWKVRDRRKIPVHYFSLTETLDGYRYAHVVGNDTPVTRFDYQFEVKIIGDNSHDVVYYENQLLGLDAKQVYFVDNLHAAAGEDHAAYVQTMLLEVGEITVAVANLEFFYIPIKLTSLENPT